MPACKHVAVKLVELSLHCPPVLHRSCMSATSRQATKCEFDRDAEWVVAGNRRRILGRGSTVSARVERDQRFNGDTPSQSQ